MFWGLFGLSVTIWLAAIFFIVKGWGESREVLPAKAKIPKTPPPSLEPKKLQTVEGAEREEEEIEISIAAPPPEKVQTEVSIDLEGFYQGFGRANVVEFPAEYIDRDHVRGASGNKIKIVEFAKNCYREIDFRCIDSIMAKEEGGKIYKANIFDLISDHYSNTEENFINFFGQLKEKFAQDIEFLNNHPDMTPINKKALVGIYDPLPQLVVWNDKELFLVMVKSKYDTLNKREMDFFKEFIIEKRLFKAKIFKVTERQEMKEGRVQITEYREHVTDKDIIEQTVRKQFTEEEIRFLEENMDKFTNEELAEKLGRSVDSITHKLSRMGIARESYEWTEEKDNFLKDNITKFSYRELAEKLGTTIPTVRARCKKLDIRK